MLLKEENIICISSIDWDFIWQQHQAIMSIFAKNGNRVLFVENTGVRRISFKDIPRLKKRIINWLRSTRGFRKESENLYVYSPLILPFPYFRIARWINRYLFLKALFRWNNIMEFHNPIIWAFLPTPIVLEVVESIPHKAFIYYCTDNLASTSKSARRIVKYEKKVLQKADAVFIMAKNMFSYCSTYNQNVTRIPMGVDTQVFINTEHNNVKPAEIANVERPIVGYIGGIRNSIDQALVIYLAQRLHDYTFIFVGPMQTNTSRLKVFKNIIFTGVKPHSELRNYINYFDACIIPYKKDEYTDNISPGKLNEYLIMGKPVISTNLNGVEDFNRDNGNILFIAKNYQEFADFIIKAIKQDSCSLREKRIEIACSNSWDKKIEQMSQIIEDIIENKQKTDLNWQEKLMRIYADVRKKTMRIVFIIFIGWFLIFYSPLVWFLAEPLKISQIPQKSDAIVVFAGGVGESGKAGQGYEERVQCAVELYKKGYAKYMIFSSGYSYVFEEPLVMKALAVSLGVPDETIILEEKAKNTYENVKFSKEILDRNKWKEILLVSSPYHMRRVLLVAKKIAPEIKIIYTPVPKSRFYSHGIGPKGEKMWKQVNFRQIRGLIHEYLGIIYYWSKGYI